jgi:uncharacterized protein (TIGR03083 family)
MDPFIESLRLSAARFSNAVRTGPLDAPVAACPGWTLADLAGHMGYIHRWARLAALTSAPPDQTAIEPPPSGEQMTSDALADWIDAGIEALVPVLAGLDPDAETWHPFPIPKVAAVWPRRQAHETQVHAWDAEHAVGATSPLQPEIAFDGIAEYFQVIAPRVVARSGRAVPGGVLAIDCVDVRERLIVRTPDESTVLLERDPEREHEVDAHVTGTAEDLLLALWNRAELPTTDAALARAWLAFGGN